MPTPRPRTRPAGLPSLSLSFALSLAFLAPPVASAQHEVRPRFGVEIPMRDGVTLVADMWSPAESGRYPAIVVRLPYMKTAEFLNATELGPYFAERGYVWLVQDTRGRGDSGGAFDFFFTDGDDGYDTVEWVAGQPWSNGRVCMMGVSYLATVQWLAALEKPPHLVCIAPTAPAGRYFDELPYQGGAFLMQWALNWLNGTSGRVQQSENATGIDWERVFQHRPLLTMDSVMGRTMPIYRAFLEHNTLDAYWDRIQFDEEEFRTLDIPALHVTGWFDGDQPGALFYWRGMAAHSPARDHQYLLAGPWTHVQTFVGGETRVGEMEFSGESIVDNKAIHLAFFDHYLKGSAETFDFPRARIYVTGSNVWKDFDAYPPAAMEHRPLYLHSGGSANSLIGDGRLGWDRPGHEPPDRYTYDPHDPVPSDIGGEHLAIDQRPIERRDDVLVYTSEELSEALEVIGDVFVHLYAASDARDTDFTAKIMDVHPDGRAIKLGHASAGIVRARYRNGYEETELLIPGEVEEYRIELYDIAHTFLAGHRIRVEVSSSAAPAFNPNQNTGNPVATDTEWTVAHQTIYHDRSRASHVLLPVMPR